MYAEIPDITPGTLVFLKEIAVSQPFGETVYVDDISFKHDGDDLVVALLADEIDTDNGTNHNTRMCVSIHILEILM